MAHTETVKIAVLDDYANIAPQYFQSLVSDNNTVLKREVEIDYFKDTLQSKDSEHPDHAAQIERLEPYHVISTMRERTGFPGSVLQSLPNLKLLLTTGNRNASIDMTVANKAGIIVAGTMPKPGASMTYGPDATNEQTWALILGLAKNIAADDLRVKSGGWQDGLVSGLAGKTLGLLGLGRLGTQAAVTGILGFGMKVIAWSNSLTQEKADQQAQSRGLPAGSFRVCASKEDLFKEADILSIHYVLSERSQGIVSKAELELMKKDAFLVNTSRGPLIDESALLEALETGRIKGAGLDVFDIEPLPKDSPWRRQDWGTNGRARVLISPHMGYVEQGTMESWYKQTAENIQRWIKGDEVKNIIAG